MDQEKLKKNFEHHHFFPSFFHQKEDVVSYLFSKLEGRSIGFGGSATLAELGLYDMLSQKNTVVWHHHAASKETLQLARHTAVYITSANAVSETGELVNIDGNGNRVGAALYGAKEIFYIVGRNKLTPDLPSALHRAKHVAAPKNAKRLHKKTPCAKEGLRCYDCDSPERICNATIILERSLSHIPTEILFVDENLGF